MIERLKKWFKGESRSAHLKEEGGPFLPYNERDVAAYKEQFKGVSISELQVPEMPGMNGDCSVVRWFKKDGDRIRKGDILCEVEMSNTIFELESYLDSYLYFRRAPGTSLQPGSVLCLLLSERLA